MSNTTTIGLEEAAKILRCCPDTAQKLAASGQIPGAKIGREWVFVDTDLIEHIRTKYKGKRWRSKKGEDTGITTSAYPVDPDLEKLLE